MNYTKEQIDGITYYHLENGVTLGTKQLPMKEADGLLFKNLSGSDRLLPYEDWRLAPEDRARDLAGRLSIPQIAGLMLYSSHQMVPFRSGGPFRAHYGGKAYEESGARSFDLTDEQKDFLEKDGIRHVLLMMPESAVTAARWNNELQARAEQLPLGIPVAISSDPRHGASKAKAEFKSGDGDVSKWPEGLGMSATFDPALCGKFAHIAALEYRAMGITTALGPQIDLATEPRWMRLEDTFGGCLKLSIEMAKHYCDGMQTTPGAPTGWGKESVLTMAKHWPSGGTGEGGRDAHYGFGCYAVYPGGKFDEHKKVFTEGALKLDGPTGKAASIMPYYTVSWNQDVKNGENVGNSYSEYIIRDLLREECGYEGVVCTDWGITGAPLEDIDSFGPRCYGVEHLSEAEQHLRIILGGVDQFGGNNKAQPILDAYEIGCGRIGEAAMRARMEQSAARILTNMFRVGSFENPYLVAQDTKELVGCQEFVDAGMDAQRRSVVMVKNNGALPLKKGIKVYCPDRFIEARPTFFRTPGADQSFAPLTQAVCEGYCTLVSTPEEADAAIVMMESPISDCYSKADRAAGGNGYLPLSLQYRPYTADKARSFSIAGGDARDRNANRSYQGKTNRTANESDLDNVLAMRRVMGDKPVICCLRVHNPCVVGEFEAAADGIFIDFGVQPQAQLSLLFGDSEPSGRLPIIIPRDMDAVETHCEDIFDDIAPYVDTQGNCYDFGYGLNWPGRLPRPAL